jgi:hypothetical protein
LFGVRQNVDFKPNGGMIRGSIPSDIFFWKVPTFSNAYFFMSSFDISFEQYLLECFKNCSVFDEEIAFENVENEFMFGGKI